MPEDLGEKTERPTSRRLREARGRGQVAKSQDLGSAIELGGGFVALVVMGGGVLAGLASLVRYVLDDRASGTAMDPAALDGLLRFVGVRFLWIAGPVVAVMLVLALLAQFLQVGWLFTLQPLMPKLDRLNPMTGFSRLFSRRNGIKTGVGLVKMFVVGTIGVMIARSHLVEIAALPRLAAGAGFAAMGRIIGDLVLWMVAVMLVIGVADFVYQRWQHTRDLKMTKQEVKDELRSMEGDVETKGRRLRMARQIALQRIRQAVPKADVVVTNPTHFAVALQYDPDRMAAPKVVAKGADFLAFRIREVAAGHGIPIVEKPALARALYADVEVGRTIPAGFFEAVAEILAYVYRLKGKEAVGAA